MKEVFVTLERRLPAPSLKRSKVKQMILPRIPLGTCAF